MKQNLNDITILMAAQKHRNFTMKHRLNMCLDNYNNSNHNIIIIDYPSIIK